MEWNNGTEMGVRTENLHQCGSEAPAASMNAPAWTPLQMDSSSSLQPIRHHSGSCFISPIHQTPLRVITSPLLQTSAGSSSPWQKQTLGKSIFGWVVPGLSFKTVNYLIRPSIYKSPERWLAFVECCIHYNLDDFIRMGYFHRQIFFCL